MGKITLDPATAAALRAAEAGTELVGPDGATVGGFVPPQLLSLLRDVEAERRRLVQEELDDVSEAELEAADAAGGEYTLADVMKLLERPS